MYKKISEGFPISLPGTVLTILVAVAMINGVNPFIPIQAQDVVRVNSLSNDPYYSAQSFRLKRV